MSYQLHLPVETSYEVVYRELRQKHSAKIAGRYVLYLATNNAAKEWERTQVNLGILSVIKKFERKEILLEAL